MKRKFNGLFSFTTDSFPILGEAPKLRGFWSAQAVWITHAGGIGKAVAEWIVNGTPTTDLRECDIARFHPHALTRPYIRARAAQQYREVYDIIHPLQQISEPRNLRLTPFFPRQKELGAVFVEDSGWERPRWYESNADLLQSLDVAGASRKGWEAREWSPIVAAEHVATRERVALFDLSPFTKLEVTGTGALAALQNLTTNQMDKPIGAITYTSLLTPSCGIKCDLTITRLAENRFLVVTGGGSGPQDLKWIQSHIPNDGSVNISDISSASCCIGLWGPQARALLSRVTDDEIGNRELPRTSLRNSSPSSMFPRWPYASPTPENSDGRSTPRLSMDSDYGTFFGKPVNPSALSPPGPPPSTRYASKKVTVCGVTTSTPSTNPYEAGIAFTVKMQKGDFIGKNALLEYSSQGPTRKLSCMTLDDPKRVVMGKEPIMDGDRFLGDVTSANFGHSVGRAIVYGYLPISHTEPNTSVDVIYFGERLQATVQKEPLYDPTGDKMAS